MARSFSTNEKAKQRLDGQWSQFFLVGCFNPTPYIVVYSAQLGTPPSSNDDIDTISYISGSGTLANVLPDMLMKIGTTAGMGDLGMCRIRKAPDSSHFYVAEVSDVNWLAGGTIYLTILDDFSLWEKQIKISSDDSTFYMDVDIPYTDQFENFDPVAVLGSNRVGSIPAGSSSVNVQLGPEDVTSSWVFDSTISSVEWSLLAGPASVTFDNANAVNPIGTFTHYGKYTLGCNVTGANGKSFMGVRYVFIFDSVHVPIGGIQISDFECQDYTQSNWSCKVTIPGVMASGYSVSDFPARMGAGIIASDFAYISGATGKAAALPVINMPGAENIRLWGWIEDETIVQHPETGDIEFVIQGLSFWMQQVTGFTEGLEIVSGTSSQWTDMPGLNVDRALWVLFHWRSTLDRIADFIPTGDTRYLEGVTNASSENLYQQVSDFLNSTIGANIGVDRHGRVFALYEPQLLGTTQRTQPTVTDIFENDIYDFQWVTTNIPPVGMVDLSGVSVTSDGSATPLLSQSPGSVYKRYGQDTPSDNWLLDTQDNANAIAGLYAGWKNNPYQKFTIKTACYIPGLDIFPNQYLNVNIPANRDPRGIGYSGRAILREMRIITDPKKTGAVTMELTCEAESFPENSITGPQPPTNPTPPLPKPPKPTPPPTGNPDGGPATVVMWIAGFGLIYTENANETDPTRVLWKVGNNGLSSAAIDNAKDFKYVASTGQCWLWTDDGIGNYIFSAPTLGATWDVIVTNKTIMNLLPAPGGPDYYWSVPNVVAFGINPSSDEAMIIGRWSTIAYFGGEGLYWCHGSSSGFSLGSGGAGVESGNGWLEALIVYCGNRWVAMFNNQFLTVISWCNRSGGSPGYNTTPANVSVIGMKSLQHAGVTGGIFYAYCCYKSNANVNIITSSDGGDTFADIGAAAFKVPGNESNSYLGVSPDGLTLMAADPNGIQPHYSTDGGTTWGNITALAGGNYHAFYCYGNDNQWVTTGAMNVLYSTDGGITWYNINGNIGDFLHTAWFCSTIRAQ